MTDLKSSPKSSPEPSPTPSLRLRLKWHFGEAWPAYLGLLVGVILPFTVDSDRTPWRGSGLSDFGLVVGALGIYAAALIISVLCVVAIVKHLSRSFKGTDPMSAAIDNPSAVPRIRAKSERR